VLLFMVPADSNDIRHEYQVLLNELEQYSPELLDKQRLLAITKCDMLDAEMMAQMKKELPRGVDHVMISSVARIGLDELKDKLWKKLHGTFPAEHVE
jgi:GTP-binding protein